jgi:regulator of sigma E protease
VAGLRTGDIITKIGTTSVVLYDDIEDALRENWGNDKQVPVTVRRRAGNDPKDLGTEQSFMLHITGAGPTDAPNAFSNALGIYPSELFVFKITPSSPAEKGGMQPGDRISKIGDHLVYNFETIVDDVQDAGAKDEPVKLSLERNGQPVNISVRPMVTSQEDPLTRQTVKRYLIGFAPQTAYHEAELTKLQIHDPVLLLKHSASETYMLADRMVRSIAKLVLGKISVKNLGGPVLIASVAGKSLDAGIIPFIQMMALISINLFLLNLFPIPILDGGHLFFFFLEGLKGNPVSIRTMEIANQVGMVFILLLVGLTLYNDISRIVLH